MMYKVWRGVRVLGVYVHVTEMYLMGRLEFRRSACEQEVQDGAVGDEVSHGLTAGYVFAGLEEQGPGMQ